MEGCEFMKTECPFCHQHYEIDDEYLNLVVECPQCRKQFTVIPLMQNNITSSSDSNARWEKVKKYKISKKKVFITFSALFVLSLVSLYIFYYPFRRWVNVYCFNDAGYTIVLANDYAHKKEWEKAKKLYDHARKLFPSNPEYKE